MATPKEEEQEKAKLRDEQEDDHTFEYYLRNRTEADRNRTEADNRRRAKVLNNNLHATVLNNNLPTTGMGDDGWTEHIRK